MTIPEGTRGDLGHNIVLVGDTPEIALAGDVLGQCLVSDPRFTICVLLFE